MKLNVFQKIAGLLCAALLGATVQAQSLSSDQEYVIGLAASLYPDLFQSHGDVKTAEGYTYLTFNSGVSVGFKSGSLYVVGGPFGNTIQNPGTISQVTTQLTNLKNSIAVTPTADMNSLFTMAAQAYPTLFSNGTSFQTSADGYLYKYFSSGVYAAIKNGIVYVKGGTFGNFYTSVGALNNVLSQLQAATNPNTGGGTTIPQGNYTLTVSGTVTVSGFAQVFPTLTIANIPAPDVNDHDDIEQAFEESLSNAAGITINSFSYDVISSTSNLVEFDISVSATITQSGFSLPYGYKLKYRYTK